MVLGTDSLASNHQLSILEEMKTIKKAFPAHTNFRVACHGLLQMAQRPCRSRKDWEILQKGKNLELF